MQDVFYKDLYECELGRIFLQSEGEALCGLYFENQRHFPKDLLEAKTKNLDIFRQTKIWLDEYFKGKVPNFSPKLRLYGSPFRLQVWQNLQKIQYAQTTSYKDLASKIAKERKLKQMSARAIGVAVGLNPISIIIPCHRVIASNGKLTGYVAGLEKKAFLLELEVRSLGLKSYLKSFRLT